MRKDARKYLAGAQPILANCRTLNGEFQGTVHNISSSGVFIETDKVLSVGEEIAIIFTFPHSKKTVRATGEIVRSSNSGIAMEIKLMFNDPDAQAEADEKGV